MWLREEARTRVRHIADAAETIAEWTRGQTFDDYASSLRLRAAVERLFTIIGEALRAAIRAQSEIADAITDADDIIAFRHVLVHGYAYVYDDFVWQIINDDLPRLIVESPGCSARVLHKLA
jgi:uncharacterized protein with HEPN domain